MVVLIILTGLLAGWFVNYLADILPFKRRLGTPVCGYCGRDFLWVNYINLSRSCPQCGRKRAFRSWVFPLLYIFCSFWIWLSPQENIAYLPGLTLLVYFGVVATIDIEHRVILHPVSFFGALIGCGYGMWQNGFVRTLEGGAAGFLFMASLYYLGFVVVKLRAKSHPEVIGQEALGFGDVNLAGVLGLILGWPQIFSGLILAILIAGAVSFVYLLIMLARRRYSADLAIPYGPFMILGAIVLLYIGPLHFI